MPDYTVTNLKRDVEDMAPRFGMAPDLESRFARKALGLEQQGLSYYRFAPNFRLPIGHRHSDQEEVYLVLSGSLRVKLEDEVVELGPFDALRVPGPVARGMEAGPDGAELIATGAPNTENKDAEMLQNWWTD